MATVLAPCLLGARPFSSGQFSRRHTCQPKHAAGVRAMAKRNKQQQAAPAPPPLPQEPLPQEPKDFFEGEGWEIFGKVLSYAVPVAVISALLIGGFAAGTYNEGATVFIDTPKSQDDTVRFFSVVDE